MLKKHDKGNLDQYRYLTENIFKDGNAQLEGNAFSPDQFPGKKTYILTDRPGLKIFEKDLGPLIISLDGFSDNDISNSVFYIYFNHDCDALPHLKRIKTFGGIFVPPVLTGKIDYHHANNWAFEAICLTESKKDRISHVNINVWNNIAEALDIELTRDVEWSATIEVSGTITLDLLTDSDTDIESEIYDNLYVESQHGNIQVDDTEVTNVREN